MELLVTLAVVAILVAVTVPSLRTMIQNNRLATQTNDLIADFKLARSEAIKRATNILVCTSSSGNACDGGGDWKQGRLVWDPVNNLPIRFRGELAGGPTNTISTSGGDPIVFDRRGLVPAAPITFALCDDRLEAKGKLVTIGVTGQVQVSPNPPGAC